ncbi:MAG: RrF2 family transcriptional regulator [Elusimicrobia bacterium]|nr:RrF2 family transcriptional regulator [Elusimicrobiota bacterium]
MKLSTRARYGAKAMLELALRYGDGPIMVREIARSQEISKRYLEHLIVSLQAAGLVETVRGKKGGCVLARPPADIKLGEVVEALEGSVAPVDCVDNEGSCPRSKICVPHDIWRSVKEAIVNVLNSVTLEDMVVCHKKKIGGFDVPMYHI